MTENSGCIANDTSFRGEFWAFIFLFFIFFLISGEFWAFVTTFAIARVTGGGDEMKQSLRKSLTRLGPRLMAQVPGPNCGTNGPGLGLKMKRAGAQIAMPLEI